MSGDRARSRWLPIALTLSIAFAAWALIFSVARQAGPVGSEADAFHAIRSVGAWFDRVGSGDVGLAVAPPREHALRAAGPALTLPALLSSFVWHVATSGYGWLGEATSLRSGYALFAGLSLPLLFSLLVRRWGLRASLFACASTLLVPRFVHIAALADGHAVSLTAWLLVLAAYDRSRASSRLGWTAATGAAIGVACAITPSALGVVLVLIVHTAWEQRAGLRAALRRGWIPLPASTLFLLTLGAFTFAACSPWLWVAKPADAFGAFLVGALTPRGPGVAWSFPLNALVMSVPTVTLALALLGAVGIIGPSAARAWGRDEERQDDGGLGGLLVVAFLVALGWASFAPASVSAQPPRWLTVLPFLGAFAGRGLDRTLRATWALLTSRPAPLRTAVGAGIAVLSLAVPLAETLRRPSTRDAAFIPLMGGPSVVADIPGFPLRDGAAARALASPIDALGVPIVTVHGNAIPFATWEQLHALGWMRTRARAAKSAADADVVVLAGAATDRAALIGAAVSARRDVRLLAVVERDGAPLAELYTLSRPATDR